MAQQTINIGTVANDNTGDPLRDAFDKVNDNFNELYLPGIATSTLTFNLNDITPSVLDEDLTLTPNGTGNIAIADLAISGNDITPSVLDADLTLTPNGTGNIAIADLAISGNDITPSVLNADLTITSNGTGIIVLDTDTLNISTPRTPVAAIGAAGDTAGDIVWDSGFIWVCTADYDGAASIWMKAALAAF